MKKILLLLSLVLSLDYVLAVPSFEPFADATANGGSSYTVGSALTNQVNPTLFSPWYPRGVNFGSIQPLIASGNLSYPGLPASTGNSVSFVPANSQNTCLDLNLPSNQANPVYASFLLKITDLTAVPTTAANNPFAAFGDDPTPNPGAQIARLGTRVLAKKVGSGYVLGTSKSATTTDFVYEPDGNAHNVGDVLFVVMGYQRVAGVQTNVTLWINPLSSSFGSNQPPAATLTAVTGSTALNTGGARVFGILSQFTTAPSGVIDDVRAGNDWATVTGGPGIYASPTNQTRNAGTNVTFRAAAFGGTPLSYQWQKNGAPLSDGGNISGASTTALTINNLLAGDAASYALVASNSYSMATSAVATLTVNDPWITVQPTNKAVNPGAATVLHVVAVGTPTLTYQWYKNTSPLSDGGNISGSQSPDLTITSFSSADVGTYNVVVFNGQSASITSSNAFVGLTDPSITAQPQSVTNIYGTTATFQVTASGTAPLSYQWHKQGFGDLSDGGNISGSHSNILTITGVAGTDSGTYSVTVTNGVGAFVDSAPAVLTVRDPAVVIQPVSVTNLTGSTVSFHAAAVGTPPLNYSWFIGNNIFLFDGAKYAGTSTDTLWVTNVGAGDQTNYYVTVFGGSGSESSVSATLTVTNPPTPISITAQPTPRKVLAGSQTVLAVGYTGSSPQFQWQLAGTNVPGATAAAYVLTNVQPSVTGSYQVIISNSVNAQTSSLASVSIVSSLHLYPTNLVSLRVGDGAQTLTTHGNSMFVDQWGPNGTYLTTMSLPDSGPDSVVAIGPTLTVTPSSVTGNGLSRSANGRYLVFGGYNTNLTFTNDLQSTAATTVPRGIGLLDDQGQYTLAVSSSSSSSGNFWRGACADGTNNYWGFSRTSSTYYFGFDQPALVIQSDWSNLRSMAIFNNRIYGVSAVAGKTGVMRFSGLPMAAETVEQVINTGSNFSSDCEVSPNGNLIYVADSITTGGGGIQRWEFNGSSWNLAYVLTDHLPVGAYYVTADFGGANPVVYAVTTEADNNQIVRISDTGSGSTGTIVAYAGPNQNFRGIRLGPAATAVAPPLLSLTRAPGAVILNWSGSFTLQSATNVTGPYTDVTNTAPYTNSTSGAQMFFRLRQ